MYRKLVIADCPKCGKRPTLYTVKTRRGTLHHIGCTTVECKVRTNQSTSLGYVLYNWNSGYSLYKNDSRYTGQVGKRRFLETVVGV